MLLKLQPTLKQEIAQLDTSVAEATAARKAEHADFVTYQSQSNSAIQLITTGARLAAFRSIKSVAECLELAEQEEGCGDYVHTDGGNTCKCMRRGVTCVPAVATSADIYVKRPCCEEDSDCPSAESCTRGTCSSCKDTASLYAVDTYGTGCDFYASTPEHCSANDDHDFTSAKMCCSCGGGCGPTGAGSCCTADSECSGDTPKCHSAGFCGCAADSDCAADAEHPLCVDGSCSGCRDTSEGATSGRYTCKQLVAWGFCGDSQFDDDDFSLASMCCGCGGGYRGEA